MRGAAAWGEISLVSLVVYGAHHTCPPLQPVVLQHLGRATRLTELSLSGDCNTWDDRVADLAAALQQLRLLQKLSLNCRMLQESLAAGRVSVPSHDRSQQDAGWCEAVRTIAKLPKLQQLSLVRVAFDALATAELPEVSQVEHLELYGTYSEAVLLSLVHSFTGLHHLGVMSFSQQHDNITGVSNAVLDAIACRLHHLARPAASPVFVKEQWLHGCRHCKAVMPAAFT